MSELRNIPSVEQLLRNATHLIERFGRPLTLDALRLTLDETRARSKLQPETALPSNDRILTQAESHLTTWTRPSLVSVLNATGVILHTNLGRAPLSQATIEAMTDSALNYSNLEYDLETGRRGSRLIHAEAILQKLLGVEAALVVNNNASAILLVLSALANKKQVIIPRSQLVEIGGGFRVPDVMKQSGAKLLEIGTTNKVRLSDFEEALGIRSSDPPSVGPIRLSVPHPLIALVMRAHRSNFKIIGFTEEPDLREIVAVAHQANVSVVDDLGSGALIDTAKYGFAHEPTVQESLEAGVDVVCFSGDKLLGGPQAGIIIGKKQLLDKIKKHPLARAVRADKTCLAGISATLTHYLKDEAEREIPVVKMMSMTLEQVQGRAEAWREALGQGEVIQSESTVGGGSLPEESIPSYILALDVKSPDKFLRKLREANPPVIARTVNDRVLLDPRTVLDDPLLLQVLRKTLDDYR
ncbi:MAG TPA: L-seryl-tRNA(Sec) selenium transferase [Anaerolineales bacterium]|nr:L-seryl-tRNA(Sec) selenium transferase [Anaerolineales bacterium]